MYILVIDLSYQTGTVFILNESLEVVRQVDAPQSHSLPIRIQELTDNGLIKLDAVAIPEGPGNFTPLRLAATIAIALCKSLKIPLIAYSPFLNQVKPTSKEGEALLDARSSLSYQTFFTQKDSGVEFSPIALVEKTCDTPYLTCKKNLGFHIKNLFDSQRFTDIHDLKISYVKQPR